ncbi:MAG: Sua5/YciO/YrdC/YwlC family protein [Arenicellales bacterium]
MASCAAEMLQEASRALLRGGVVAYPTEGVYGLGCNPRNARAVYKLLRLKRRSWRQGLILIGAEWRHIEPWVNRAGEAAIARARATWPGPHTWLLPAGAGTPAWLRGEHDTIAVRVTSHPLAAALCRRARGAVVSTSANLHGRPPALSAAQVRRLFGERIDYVLPGRLGGLKGPTEIRDGRTGEIVRPG